MAFFMNKNVAHNGKDYAKGSLIESSDENFKLLSEAGHVNEGSGEPVAEVPQFKPVVGSPEVAPAKVESDEEKSSKKKK